MLAQIAGMALGIMGNAVVASPQPQVDHRANSCFRRPRLDSRGAATQVLRSSPPWRADRPLPVSGDLPWDVVETCRGHTLRSSGGRGEICDLRGVETGGFPLGDRLAGRRTLHGAADAFVGLLTPGSDETAGPRGVAERWSPGRGAPGWSRIRRDPGGCFRPQVLSHVCRPRTALVALLGVCVLLSPLRAQHAGRGEPGLRARMTEFLRTLPDDRGSDRTRRFFPSSGDWSYVRTVQLEDGDTRAERWVIPASETSSLFGYRAGVRVILWPSRWRSATRGRSPGCRSGHDFAHAA